MNDSHLLIYQMSVEHLIAKSMVPVCKEFAIFSGEVGMIIQCDNISGPLITSAHFICFLKKHVNDHLLHLVLMETLFYRICGPCNETY